MRIEKALEAFARGISFTRSFTHPYEVVSLGNKGWLLRDGPRTKGDPRNAEVVIYGWEPEAALATIRENVPGRYFLCVMTQSDAEKAEAEAAYKGMGFRLMNREPLFVAPTEGITQTDDRVRRVTERVDADAVTKITRSKQILLTHLSDENSPLRLFAAYDGDTPVGWVRSVRTHDDCGWVASLFVQAEHRGKGYGRGLINALLADDAGRGLTHSVLLASHAGARLYPHLGYVELGTLLVLSPPRSPR